MNNDASCVTPILVLLVFIIIFKTIEYEVRLRKIRSYNWDAEITKKIINRQVFIGMTFEMALLSWGHPWSKDNIETTAISKSERWVYGRKGRNTKYLYFTNGKLWKSIIN